MPVQLPLPARILTPLRAARGRVARALSAAGETLDRSSRSGLALLLLCVLLPAVLKARFTPFTCDEVYTLRIAQQPTQQQVFEVSRRIDLHPPLHYLAERAALALPLPRWFTARLPSLLATAGLFVLCWMFVRRTEGPLAAFVAAGVLWFSPALPFAWLNRPYALWLFFLALLAVCWQRAREHGASSWWTLGIFLAAAGMILDYMAGLLCILPFLAADLLPHRLLPSLPRQPRTSGTDRLRWLRGVALLAPCAAGVLYLRQLHDFASNTFAPQYLDWAGIAAASYSALLFVPLGVVGICVTAAWLVARGPGASSGSFAAEPARLPASRLRITDKPTRDALIVGTGLVCLPAWFAILAAVRHTQFFTRYSACGALGVAFLTAALLPRMVRSLRVVTVLHMVSLVIAAALLCQDARFSPTGPWRAYAASGVRPLTLSELDPAQPLVIARAVGYTEMNEREPASLLDRTYYLYDRAAAERFSGSTVFETIATTASLLHYQTRTAALRPFLAEHRSFYLVANYTHPEEWLPRYLQASGAHLRYLGKFASTYEDDDLYFVTLPDEPGPGSEADHERPGTVPDTAGPANLSTSSPSLH